MSQGLYIVMGIKYIIKYIILVTIIIYRLNYEN